MNIKTIRRDDWTRILEKDVIIRDFVWKGIPGKISLLKIGKVSSPISVSYADTQVKIVDAGYSWVQIALEGQFYWITSMFDEENRLVQIYIDITDGNVSDVPDPYFADLYLDYVVHVPARMVKELDRDELTEAFQNGRITKLQYERSLFEGDRIFRYLKENLQELIDLLCAEQKKLLRIAAEEKQKTD